MITSEQIREYINNGGKIITTAHIQKRIDERHIKYKNIIRCIRSGEIIEQYPDDFPFPSCLILWFTENGDPLHCVVAMSSEELRLVTAYYPDPNEWESDYKTRKKVNRNEML